MTELSYKTLDNPIDRWADLIDYYRKELEQESWKNWLFRGHQDNTWKLASSLERAVVTRAKKPPLLYGAG